MVKENNINSTAVLEQVNVSSEGNNGIFTDVNDAIKAAKEAQELYARKAIADRSKLIEAIRSELLPYAEEYGREAAEETGMGRADDKKIKVELALQKTPGTEDLQTEALTGDHGMTLYEHFPYGVIGAILPSTNPVATIINNGIGMLAAGNTVYFSVHPGANDVSIKLIQHINQIAKETIDLENLLVTVDKAPMDAVDTLMHHEDIAILVITGGPTIVNMGLSSGKKTIGAGAGNPPAFVDETADIKNAAQEIYGGANFDNGILCTAEKAVVAVESIEEELVSEMEKAGAFLVTDEADIQKIVDTTIEDGRPSKQYIGKNASVILDAAGIEYTGDPRLIILRAEKEHPLVMTEMLMPILPVVKVNDFDEGLEVSLEVEQGYLHTAVLHTGDLKRADRMAKEMETSLFILNGASYSGLGMGGEGPTTFTIATPTGEGTTSAKHFTRTRRIASVDGISVKSK